MITYEELTEEEKKWADEIRLKRKPREDKGWYDSAFTPEECARHRTLYGDGPFYYRFYLTGAYI